MIFSSLALHNMPFDIQRLSFLIFGIFDQEYVPHYGQKLGEKKSMFFEIFSSLLVHFGCPLLFPKKIMIYGKQVFRMF